MKKIIKTGEKFGRLTIVKEVEPYVSPGGQSKRKVKCKCDCGGGVSVAFNSLKVGKTKSCGCLRKEKMLTSFVTHGKSSTRLYRIYAGIKKRCDNQNYQNYQSYHRYGGRGIKMCEEWRNDFMSFYNWAMANGYASNLTLDRKENNDSYNPDGCRWVSHQVQMNNTSCNVFVVIDGVNLTLGQVARKYKMNYKLVWKRYSTGKRGLDLIKPIEARYSRVPLS